MDPLGILSFFQSLARFLNLIQRLSIWLGLNDFDQFMNELEHAIDQLEGAHDKETKLEAARSVLTLIRTLK